MSTHKTVIGPEDNRVIACRVYGRTIADCSDCSFSILQRPAYLDRIAAERNSAE